MQNNLLKVGITGGIGAGKSIVSKIFNILGIPVYNADAWAKKMMVQDPDIVQAIKDNFGKDAYLSDGELNRIHLAKKIFVDPEKRNVINEIVHPTIALDFEKWTKAQTNVQYILKEAALLFESAAYKKLNYIITVVAPIDQRISRVLIRDKHRTKRDIENIISVQSNDEEKVSKSQFIVTNDNSQLLIPQVLKIHDLLVNTK